MLTKDFLSQYEDKLPPWGPMGYIVYKRTYARMIPELGRAEEWNETCERVCRGLLEIGGVFTQDELELLYDSLFNLKGFVSGRALWQLGTQTVLDVGADSLYNCWLVSVRELESFCFTFNQLMLGGGVGFNILPQNVYELPTVRYSPEVGRVENHDCDYIVPDNREGWVELLRRVLDAFFVSGKRVLYDTSCIRAKGKPIKGFGGTASGPEDLVKGIKQIVTIIKRRYGGKLTPVDCMDIMNIIGQVVVAGNVRRSSEIALGCPKDLDFLDAKNWGKHQVPNWRTMSNNSVLCNSYDELRDEFWDSGYEPNLEGNAEGEPYGLVNLRNLRRFGRLADGPLDGLDPYVEGTNPCVIGSTKVMTADGRGAVPIQDLDGDTPVYCVNKDDELVVRWGRNPRITGKKVDTLVVTFDNGESMTVTPNHKFYVRGGGAVRADSLQAGQSLRILTRYTPESCEENNYSRANRYICCGFGSCSMKFEHEEAAKLLYGETKSKHVHHVDGDRLNNHPGNLSVEVSMDHLKEHSSGKSNPRFSGISHQELVGWGNKLCESLGRLASTEEWHEFASKNHLPKSFSKYRKQELGTIGQFLKNCAASLGYETEADPRVLRTASQANKTGLKTFIQGGSLFVLKECECCELELKVPYDMREVSVCSGCKHSYKTPEPTPEAGSELALNHKILSVEPGEPQDVWNITVDECHNVFYGGWDEGLTPKGRRKLVGVLSPQCGEIGLAHKEGCNLAELVLPNLETVEEAKAVAAVLYKACKTISNHGFSDPGTQEIVNRHHRIGIGITGLMQSPSWYDGRRLDSVYRHLREVDLEYSHRLGIAPSIKLTTSKPSGTLSLLPGVTPGIHAAFSRYYMRTVRFSSDHPLVEVCRDHGYKIEPKLELDGTHDHSTSVIYFPIAADPKATLAEELDVINELEVQKFVQSWWADNSVSSTHYFNMGDVPRIRDWLHNNFDESVKACSFLQRVGHGFAQAPYQPISEEEYHRESAKVRPINFALVEEQIEDTDQKLECEGGSCPVK